METEIHEGGCLCGAVRYRARGEPASANACHCTQCRRQTGSALPAFASWPRDRVELIRGVPTAYAATPRAERSFCASCGSTLFWSRHDSGEIDVFLGTLDRPERIRPPDFELWTVHRQPWVAPVPGATQHREGMPQD